MSRPTRSAWLVVVALVACRREPAGKGAPADGGAPPVIADAAVIATIPEASVRALVDAWLEAQNRGDFAAYGALYATRMTGVKRVGPRTRTFDRARWLTDRERMFRRPMVVVADDIEVRGGSAVATVELVQTFRQGKFEDRGPKRLIIVREGDALRIASEEMLQSTIAVPPGATVDAPLHAVIELDGADHIVLGDGDHAWGTGPVERVQTGLDHQVVGRRAAGALPDAKRIRAMRFTVYSGDGSACEAGIDGLYLVGGGTPHFSTVQDWNDAEGGPRSDDERAADQLESAQPVLVGAIRGDCGGDLAVPAGRAPIAIVPPAPVDATVEAIAVEAFRRLPGYREIQAEWKAAGERGPWVAAPSVASFAGGGRTFVLVGAEEGPGCGDFAGSLSALFEIGPDDAPRPLHVSFALTAAAVLDSDGDGAIEIVGRQIGRDEAWSYLVPGQDLPAVSFSFPYGDCDC
jgi:ketosteroid isomerase-like protein